MTLSVNDGGTWRAASPYVNDGGTWKEVQELWVNDGGTWKRVFVALSFNPAPGNYSSSGTGHASLTINASKAVIWNWTQSGFGSVSIASGGSSTSITFEVSESPQQQTQQGSWNVSVTHGGSTHNWTISLTAEGAGVQQ